MKQSKMTPAQILSRIKAIAWTPACGSEPFAACDLVDQDSLFNIQNELATLMLDLANSISVKQADKLVKDFPYLYSMEEER